jgi:hypothetical protein
MNSSYGPCEVHLFGSVYPEGEVIKKAKIDFLGESPNATARVYQWVDGSKMMPGRFRVFDTLGASTITSLSEDVFRVTGISQQMVEEVGLAEANAEVTWEVTVQGCESC